MSKIRQAQESTIPDRYLRPYILLNVWSGHLTGSKCCRNAHIGGLLAGGDLQLFQIRSSAQSLGASWSIVPFCVLDRNRLGAVLTSAGLDRQEVVGPEAAESVHLLQESPKVFPFLKLCPFLTTAPRAWGGSPGGGLAPRGSESSWQSIRHLEHEDPSAVPPILSTNKANNRICTQWLSGEWLNPSPIVRRGSDTGMQNSTDLRRFLA